MPFGMETIYPNMFVMIIAPPGRCRKGSPVGFAKKILTDVGFNVFVDSASKRAMTKQLHEISKDHSCAFQMEVNGSMISKSQCPLALISKELSSFFAVNLKEMVEVLTDLFDAHDEWHYKTSDKGEDCVRGVCVSCLFASTPGWIARNLPEEAIGGGFTSRFVIVYGNQKYKFVPKPPVPDKRIYRKLSEDLARIKTLSGEFTFTPEAEKIYVDWYGKLQRKAGRTFDECVEVFLQRQHVIAIKAAMGLHVAYDDRLVITGDDISQSIRLCEQVEQSIPLAFGGHGRADLAQGINTVSIQLRTVKEASLGELLRINYNNLSRPELLEIISTLREMGSVDVSTKIKGEKNIQVITWLGKGGIKKQL